MESNSNVPPTGFANGAKLPRRFRVRNSRATLIECQNLCDSKVLGAIVWSQASLTLGWFDRQIIDAPAPFLEGLCSVNEVPDRLRTYLMEIVDDAQRLGFGSPLFSVARSSGMPCSGGTVRIPHESSSFFVQAVVSASGPTMQGEVNVVSASGLHSNIETFATSSGRPKYNRPPSVKAQYFRDADLSVLVQCHRQWPLLQGVEMARISTVEDLALVIDHMTTTYFLTQIERGILEPVLDHP